MGTRLRFRWFLILNLNQSNAIYFALETQSWIKRDSNLGKVHLIWQGGDEDIEGGLRKFLDTRRGGSEKIVALGGGAPKICILQNQHMTSSYRSDGFQLNNLMTCATQLYHVVYRYNKCSLSNYYTLVHPKNALENCITTVSQVCHSINHWRQ